MEGGEIERKGDPVPLPATIPVLMDIGVVGLLNRNLDLIVLDVFVCDLWNWQGQDCYII